jgi:cytochrome c-type biogenesis protein CcmH
MKMPKPSTPGPALGAALLPLVGSADPRLSLRAKGSKAALKVPLHEGEGFRVRAFSIIIALLLLLALPAAAQSSISDDEVNEVARKLYCPVCENIPLDVCPTLACSEWREEIRTQLASGATEQDVINDFVARYGEQVVGTPLDPMLRTLSLLTPWLIGLVAVLSAAFVLVRWRGGQPRRVLATVDTGTKDDDYYRTRIEQDLQARR